MRSSRPPVGEKDMEVLFGEIFREHESSLYALALRLTKSDFQAKDIIQDVFLKLWESRNILHHIENLDGWLYRITENKIIDFLRKTAVEEKLRNAVWNRLQVSGDDAGEVLSQKEYHQILRKAIEMLPPQRKLIYQLNKEGDLSYKEIAEELHISKHTVKNQLSSAMQSIRNFLTNNTKAF